MTLPLADWPILELLRLIGLFAIGCLTSYLVKKEKLKVNYSRKILHFSQLLSTLLINRTFFDYSMEYFIISGTLTFLQSLLFVEPLRRRISFLNFMFLSYDRPEDRPLTFRLVITQVVGMNIALIAVAYLYELSAVPLDLLAVPLLITAFGDGLAEPIGVRFGMHKYKVRDLFGNRHYTRSIEGSAMVFLASLITLIGFQEVFPQATLLFMLAVLPLLMTITEAYSPHTWDNPFMYLIGGLSVYLIIMLT